MHARQCCQQPARFVDFFRVDVCLESEGLVPRFNRHRNLLKRCIAGTLSDAVYGTLYLTRTVHNARKRVRYAKTEVVVTMNADDRFADVGDPFDQRADDFSVLIGNRIADGVGNIDDGGSFRDDSFQNLTEIFDVATRPILGREFYVLAERFSMADCLHRIVENLFASFAEFILEMNI